MLTFARAAMSFNKPGSTEKRQIRVFISSTFLDMQEERTYLMTKVFPILQQKAARKGVSFVGVDLRWGITEDIAESGRTMEVCFEQIDQSRPFFIGILGDRYGWCPSLESFNSSVTDRYSWVNDYVRQGKSITEMEMQYGALNKNILPEEPMGAFFWIKESSDDSDAKLKELKEYVRESTDHPCHYYKNAEDLGEQVLNTFDRLIDEIYPEKEISDDDRTKEEQYLFTESCRSHYVRVDENILPIEAFLDDDESRILCIEGVSGIGKSTTIVNWMDSHRDDPNHAFISFFVLGQGNSCSINHLKRAVLHDANKLLGKPVATVNEYELDGRFEEALKEAANRFNLVLIIDGVDNLIEAEEDKDIKYLTWIPDLGPRAKIVLSGRTSSALQEIASRRDLPVVRINPLGENEKRLLTRSYLGQYGKRITEEQEDIIANDVETGYPRLLRAILNELRKAGTRERMSELIDLCIRPESVGETYDMILQLVEEDYGREYVEPVLMSLAISRFGLSEESICRLSGKPMLFWYQLQGALFEHIATKRGRCFISNQHLKDSVLKRYQDHETKSREDITRAIIKDGVIEMGYDFCECLFQVWRTGNIQLLYDALDFEGLHSLCKTDPQMLPKYWAAICDGGFSKKKFLPRKHLFIGKTRRAYEAIAELEMALLLRAAGYDYEATARLYQAAISNFCRLITHEKEPESRTAFSVKLLQSHLGLCEIASIMNNGRKLRNSLWSFGDAIRKYSCHFSSKEGFVLEFFRNACDLMSVEDYVSRGFYTDAVEICDRVLSELEEYENMDVDKLSTYSGFFSKLHVPFSMRGDTQKAREIIEFVDKVFRRLVMLNPNQDSSFAWYLTRTAPCCGIDAMDRMKEAHDIYMRINSEIPCEATITGIEIDLGLLCQANGRIEESEEWMKMAEENLSTVKQRDTIDSLRCGITVYKVGKLMVEGKYSEAVSTGQQIISELGSSVDNQTYAQLILSTTEAKIHTEGSVTMTEELKSAEKWLKKHRFSSIPTNFLYGISQYLTGFAEQNYFKLDKAVVVFQDELNRGGNAGIIIPRLVDSISSSALLNTSTNSIKSNWIMFKRAIEIAERNRSVVNDTLMAVLFYRAAYAEARSGDRERMEDYISRLKSIKESSADENVRNYCDTFFSSIMEIHENKQREIDNA